MTRGLILLAALLGILVVLGYRRAAYRRLGWREDPWPLLAPDPYTARWIH